jgi:hypothetical protein
MKITVINKAITIKKPTAYCPWVMDNVTEKKN